MTSRENHPRRVDTLAWLALSVLFAPGALAESAVPPRGSPREDADAAALARRLHGTGEVLSLEQIAKRARTLRPGTLIDAELTYEHEHGGYVYELHFVDPQGEAWAAEFDARSGDLLEHGGGGD